MDKLLVQKEIDHVRHHHWGLCGHLKLTELAEENNQNLSCSSWVTSNALPRNRTKPHPWLHHSQRKQGRKMPITKAIAARPRSGMEGRTQSLKPFPSWLLATLGCLICSALPEFLAYQKGWCLLYKARSGIFHPRGAWKGGRNLDLPIVFRLARTSGKSQAP